MSAEWTNSFSFSQTVFFVLTIITVLLLVLFTLFTGLSTDIFIHYFLDQPWSLGRSLLLVLKKFFPLVVYFIIFSLIWGLLLTLFTVILYFSVDYVNQSVSMIIKTPIIILQFVLYYFLVFTSMIFFIPAVPSMIYEKSGPFKSIKRSFTLIRGDFIKILGFYLFLNFLLLIITIFIFFFIIVTASIIYTIFLLIYENIVQYEENVFYVIVLYAYILGYIIVFFYMYSISLSFQVATFFNQKIQHENFGVELLVLQMVHDSSRLQQTGLNKETSL